MKGNRSFDFLFCARACCIANALDKAGAGVVSYAYDVGELMPYSISVDNHISKGLKKQCIIKQKK